MHFHSLASWEKKLPKPITNSIERTDGSMLKKIQEIVTLMKIVLDSSDQLISSISVAKCIQTIKEFNYTNVVKTLIVAIVETS